MEASGIILAGGASSRMGRDKSLMVIDQQTLIERTVNELRKVTQEIVIASNSAAKYRIPGIEEVPDIFPGRGPLAGIHAGLKKVTYEYTFVISCDMPMFKAEVAQYLLERSPGYDVVVPRIYEHLEPLYAVYSKTCLKHIEACLKAGITKVIEFYPMVKVLTVTQEDFEKFGNPEELFYNLNTPADYMGLVVRKQLGEPEGQKN